jgi:hypothetical protein
MQATRHNAYMALYEQYIPIRGKVEFYPMLGQGSAGVVVGYIDRSPADSTQATLSKALVEKEKVVRQVSEPFSIVWTPRILAEMSAKAVDPGTTATTAMHFITGKVLAYDVTEAPNLTVLGEMVTTFEIMAWGTVAI